MPPRDRSFQDQDRPRPRLVKRSAHLADWSPNGTGICLRRRNQIQRDFQLGKTCVQKRSTPIRKYPLKYVRRHEPIAIGPAGGGEVREGTWPDDVSFASFSFESCSSEEGNRISDQNYQGFQITVQTAYDVAIGPRGK